LKKDEWVRLVFERWSHGEREGDEQGFQVVESGWRERVKVLGKWDWRVVDKWLAAHA